MTHLVVGLGEVGSAVQNVLKCDGFDHKTGGDFAAKYDYLHICFPFSDEFVYQVKRYVEIWQPQHVIVHSSVPLYTCDPHGWTHSPIRGVHPKLELGIKTFVKYFGGYRSFEAAEPFRQLGIICQCTERAATTEALKLWDTTQYGVMIMLQKEIHTFCEKHGLDFDMVYTDANHTYDIGYEALNRPEVTRPYLKYMPGPIGGHCVIPNAHLLDSPIAKQLIEFNDQIPPVVQEYL